MHCALPIVFAEDSVTMHELDQDSRITYLTNRQLHWTVVPQDLPPEMAARWSAATQGLERLRKGRALPGGAAIAGPSRDPLQQHGTAPLPPLGHVPCPDNHHKLLTVHELAVSSERVEDSMPAHGSAKRISSRNAFPLPWPLLG